MKFPDISVIVCSYNHDKWLERCIRSLNHQMYIEQDDYEILLVDDGSVDDTQLVIGNMSFVPNLRTMIHEKNKGLPFSLNEAIKKARGRYIVRVDSDDYVARQYLHIMRLFLDKNRFYQAVAVDYEIVDSFEISTERHVNSFEEQIACGIMFRKECLFDVGLYNESYSMREGHELRKRFEEKFKIAHLELPLYKYRMHSCNRTKNKQELVEFDKKLNNEV